MNPSPQLARVLAAEDLDDLSDVLSDLGRLLASGDQQVVRSVLSAWRDEQAISNLLMYARLIPADIRIAALLRGLDERKQPYFILAALIGVQDLGSDAVTADECAALRDRLLYIIASDKSLLAQRATVALRRVATAADGGAICNLLHHSNEIVRHNLLAWLLRTFDPRTSCALNELVDASVLSGEAKERVRALVAEYVEASRQGKFTLLMTNPLCPYLPNLRDLK